MTGVNGQGGIGRRWQAGVVLAALLAAMLFPGHAQAQQMPDEQARPPEDVRPPEAEQEQAEEVDRLLLPLAAERPYLTSQILRQSTWVLSSAVRDTVGARLAPPPVAPPVLPPLGFAGQPAWLAYDGKTVGAVAEMPAQPMWNVWVNPSVTWSRHSDPVVGSDGHLVNLSLGVDYRIVERGVLGVLFNHERADYDTPPTLGTFENRGNGIGAYGGYALTDAIVIDGLVMWKALDNEVADPISFGRFDSRRWIAAGNVTAYLYRDQLRFSPTAGLTWSRETQDSFISSIGVFSPRQVTGTTTLNVGGQLGHGFALANGGRIEPWIGVTGSWDVSRSQSPPPAVPGRELDRFDLTVTPGLTVQFAQRTSLSLRADFAGLARSNYRQTSVGGQLSVQF